MATPPELPTTPTPAPIALPTFREALRFWFKLGLVSFGGPSGQIALMHTEIVDKRKWISEERFLHALNYCMLLPGPEAQQLATYIGWLMHGTRGGLAAGILFVLPAAVLLLALSWIYMAFGQVAWIAAFFYGLKPAVIAIVAVAVLRVGQRALKTRTLWAIAGLSFVAIYFLKAPFPAIVFGAGLVGWIGGHFFPGHFQFNRSAHPPTIAAPGPDAPLPSRHIEFPRLLKRIGIGLVVWLAPVLLAGLLLGWKHAITKEGLFFSKAALITFGGAYAVLPYVGQQAVDVYQWLSPLQMLDGLALAETTPGPLIMVLQFVGFVGAWQNPGDLPALVAAILGAMMTTWVTFAPSFLFIFAGAPYIEKMRGVTALTNTLNAITAAVVGVILNLAVWFAVHALFTSIHITESRTQETFARASSFSIDSFVLFMSIIGFVALQKVKIDVIYLVPAFGLIGILHSYLS